MLKIPQFKSQIARKMRDLRLRRRWSQSRLSSLLGISQSRLSRLEKGEGSFTAEQLLVILQTFNVPLSYFHSIRGGESQIQNALARLGASNLQEDPNSLPSEKLEQASDVIREALLSAGSSRNIVSIAPILVLHAKRLDLHQTGSRLRDAGFFNRLGWVIENTSSGIERELQQDVQQTWILKYRKAQFILERFLEFYTPNRDEAPVKEDVLDLDIGSRKTIESVQTSRSEISKKWRIITRIQPDDFAEALKAARENH